MVTVNEVHAAVQEHTDDTVWEKQQSGPAFFKLVASNWRLEVEARNPKSDDTWRITLKNLTVDEEISVGPMQSENVVDEVIALLDESGL